MKLSALRKQLEKLADDMRRYEMMDMEKSQDNGEEYEDDEMESYDEPEMDYDTENDDDEDDDWAAFRDGIPGKSKHNKKKKGMYSNS